LRKGKVLRIIIIIIISICNTVNRPDIVSEPKNKEETCILIDVAILRTEVSCKRKQKRN